MPEKILLDPDQPGGPWIQVADMSGATRRWWKLQLEKQNKGNEPATITEPDPDNPAVMKEVPNPAYVPPSAEDDFVLSDMLMAQVLLDWGGEAFTAPLSKPYTPAQYDAVHLDWSERFDAAVVEVSQHLLRGAPKPPKSGPTSGDSSDRSAPARPRAPSPKTSAKPSGSSGDGSAPAA